MGGKSGLREKSVLGTTVHRTSTVMPWKGSLVVLRTLWVGHMIVTSRL